MFEGYSNAVCRKLSGHKLVYKKIITILLEIFNNFQLHLFAKTMLYKMVGVGVPDFQEWNLFFRIENKTRILEIDLPARLATLTSRNK